MRRFRQPVYKFCYKGRWRKWTDKGIEAGKYGDPTTVDFIVSEAQMNPLAYFMPHGKKRKGRYRNDGAAAINDWNHDLILVTAPNQTGKSALGAIRTILSIIPCDPKWPCFSKAHGLRCPEWTGPKIAIVASYEWGNTYSLWADAYQKFIPRHELGPYAANFGSCFNEEANEGTAFAEEKGRTKVFAQGFKRGVETLTLACGSKIIFLCYHQNMSAWTGKQCDVAHLDEQCPEDLFDELSQRQSTRGEYHPIIMTLTGHCVEGRPDTGSAGWIKQKVLDGSVTKGRKFAQYKITMESVPDALITLKEKRAKYIQWVKEPEQMHDEKKTREGKARYFGEWEEGGGIIISAWNPQIHLIKPFDLGKYKPSYFRMIDHGENPCAALIVALLPWGDAVCVKEYYEYGKSVGQNATDIVEKMCGNIRRRYDDGWEFEEQTWPVYEEVFSEMEFEASELDSRSYGKHLEESRRLLGQAYNDWGLVCTPADGRQGHTKDNDGLIDILCQWFEMDKERQHINVELGRKVPEIVEEQKCGAPRVYIFDTLKHLPSEIRRWTRNPKTGKPSDKDEHLIDCLKYFTARPRRYNGEYYMGDSEENEAEYGAADRSEITGY